MDAGISGIEIKIEVTGGKADLRGFTSAGVVSENEHLNFISLIPIPVKRQRQLLVYFAADAITIISQQALLEKLGRAEIL